MADFLPFAGSYCVGGVQTLCAAGTFSNTTGASVCSVCDAGYASTAGSTNCTLCPIATYSNGAICAPCGAGTFSNTAGATTCALCAAGSMSTSGATSCTTCPIGTWANSSGSTACVPPTEYYIPPRGLTGYTNNIFDGVLYEVRNPFNAESANPQWYAFDNDTATYRSSVISGTTGYEYCPSSAACSYNAIFGVAPGYPPMMSNGAQTTRFNLDGVGVPHFWVELYTSKPTIVTKIALYNVNWYQQWILCGSNNNANWFTIFTKNNVGALYSSNVWIDEPIAPYPAYNATKYTYLRIAVVRALGWPLQTAEVRFWTNTIYDYPIPSGFSVVNGTYVRTSCDIGYKLVNGACMMCENGTWQNGPICQSCPWGMNSSMGSFDLSNCSCINNMISINGNCSCVPGSVLQNMQCNPCAPGSYCANGFQTACSANTYSAANASSCINCAANANAPSGSSGCTCNAGYVGDGFNCVACAAGTFASSSLCLNCSQGFYSNLSASVCTLCPSATYNMANGSGTCSACPANSWCSAGTLNQCPLNSASLASSITQNACLCEPGYFGSGARNGTSPCALCWPNFWCPGGNSDILNTCPEFAVSPAGASEFAQCSCLGGYSMVNGSCICLPNYYCPGVNTSQCPANSSSPAGSVSIASCTCNPGFYGVAETGCIECPVGSYCPGNGTAIACTANALTASLRSISANECFCDRGYVGTNNSACAPCPANSWCWTGIANLCPANTIVGPLASFMSNCTCMAGYYGPNGGPCTACAADSYCEGGTVQTQCPALMTAPAQSTMLSNCECVAGFVKLNSTYCVCAPGTKLLTASTCTTCEASTYCSNNVQTSCTPNAAAPAGSSSISNCSCNSGYYGNELSCSACPQGTYGTSPGTPTLSGCILCPFATYSSALAATSAAQCSACSVYANTSTSGSTSAAACQCKPTYYGDGLSCAACKVCSPYASTSGSCNYTTDTTSCVCNVGYWGSGTVCNQAAPGTYSVGGPNYTVCVPGTYASGAAMSSCSNCSSGTYSSGTGQSLCVNCVAGQYAPDAASTACSNCSAGTYVASSGSSACAICPYGAFSAAGAAVCSLCSSFGNTSSPGSVAASACFCNANYYGDGVNCLPCTANSASTAASIYENQCTCNSGYYGNALVSGPCSPGYFSSTGLEPCTACAAGYSQPDPGSRFCEKTPVGYYNPSNTNSTTNLIAYYSFWNHSNNQLTDGTGMLGPLTNTGNPLYTTDGSGPFPYSEYVTFDGSSSFMTLPNLNLGQTINTNGLSICMWYSITSCPLLPCKIWEAGETPTKNAIIINSAQAGRLNYQYRGSDGAFAGTVTTDLSFGSWTHICVTVSKTQTWRIFAGGSQAGPDVSPYSLLTSGMTTYNYLGRGSGNYFFNGKVDEFRIYNVALGASDVMTLYSFRTVSVCASALFAGSTCCGTCPDTATTPKGCIRCKECSVFATQIMSCPSNSSSDVSVCSCNSGYYGNGFSCTPCKVCSPYATMSGACNATADASSCTCNSGFYGDGVNCTLCPAGKTI